MIRSFEILMSKKMAISSTMLGILRTVDIFVEVVCHNERKTDHKKMRTVLSTGIMSLAARHGISVVWNSTSVKLVGRYCPDKYENGADVDVKNYVSPDIEDILHCKIDDLCEYVSLARSSRDMIRSFEESAGRLVSWLS